MHGEIMQENRNLLGPLAAFTLILTSFGAQAQDPAQIERGRYMVLTGHCNNCHTAGYAPKEGNVPEKDWLLGSGPQGWRGPWGTTYASNLRLTVPAMTEEQWVIYIKTFKPRPPMPWWSLKETTEQDLRAMYQYIKSLGVAGQPAQPYLPPDKEPKQPYIQAPLPPK
jgi:mono/diheme cytochrome c family protein